MFNKGPEEKYLTGLKKLKYLLKKFFFKLWLEKWKLLRLLIFVHFFETDIGWGVSMFYLHGKTSRCASLSTLQQIMLLHMHSSMAYWTTFPMSSLSSVPSSSWTCKLSMGWRSYTTIGYTTISGNFQFSSRRLPQRQVPLILILISYIRR